MRRSLGVLSLAIVLLAAGCGGDDGPDSTATETGATTSSDGVRERRGAGAARRRGRDRSRRGRSTRSKTWTLTFDTSCGSFVVTLDLDGAPSTSASLVALAKAGFYDDTVFHRIVPGFVIQGGDPTQTGTGGPGYATVDAPAQDATYVKGVVAMAKTQTEPAGTSGSQFFVVTGDDIGLPPDYAIVGTVTEGIDVVERIGELGDAATEQPTQPVVVEAVTASSS